MFSSKYGKCQSGSISATPSAEMNSVEMTFAIAVIPSGQVVSAGRPAQHPELIGRPKTRPGGDPAFGARHVQPTLGPSPRLDACLFIQASVQISPRRLP